MHINNVDERKLKEISKRQIRLLKKGFDLGGNTCKKREELYREIINLKDKK